MKHKLIYGFVLLAAFLIFWGLGLYYAQLINTDNSRFSIYYPDRTITQKEFMTAAEYAKVKVKLINYLENKTVTGGIREEEAVLTVAEVYSNMIETIALPVLCGDKLYTGDLNGCMIDKESAFHIFGTTQAVGNELIWKGNKYLIKGVADTKVPLLLVNEPDKNHSFKNAELVFPAKDGNDGEENKLQSNAAQQFIRTNRLGNPEAVLDHRLIGSFLSWICKFPAYLILLWFIITKGRKWYNQWKIYYLGYKKAGRLDRKKHIMKAVLLAGLLIVCYFSSVFTLFWAGGLSPKLPLKFIPNGWSNLKSYDNAIKEMADGVASLGNIRLYLKDLVLKKSTYQCMLCIGAALILLIVYLAVSHGRNALNTKKEIGYISHNRTSEVNPIIERGAFLQPIITVLILLAVSTLLYRLNIIFHAPTYYRLLLPVFMAFEELEGLFI